MYKSKLLLIKDMLAPSGLSVAITFVVATFLILAGSSQVLGSAVPIYRLLLGDSASGALVEITRQDFINAFKVFDNMLVNNILLFVFWGLVGTTVWILVQNTATIFGEIAEYLQEVHYAREGIRPAHRALTQTIMKVIYHFTLLVVISVYIFILWSIVYRWLVNVFISGLGIRITPFGIFIMLVSISAMALALHILTILFRMLFARTRLLG